MKINIDWKVGIGFVILMTSIFFFFGFEKIIFLDPQGIHFIRQTDSLSFVSQYYNLGYDFFNPRLFNLESVDGRAACEFPILYYLTAMLYSVFGEKVYVLKIINLVISYAGIYFVFKMSYQILKDYIYAILISLFLMTSTVFNHYSLNFLPDSAALGFVFIGWYYYFKFEANRRKKTIVLSLIFFTLGSLIKITHLISPITILTYYVGSLLLKKEQANKTIRFLLIGLLAGIIIVIFWNIYVIYYNSHYNSSYFTTGARSIWGLSSTDQLIVWDYIRSYWYNKYFAYSSYHIILVFILFQIAFLRKLEYKTTTITLILFLGSLSYFLLFYAQFRDHDYYFLVFLPFIVFVLINGIKVLLSVFKKRWVHIVLKLALVIVVLAGINYSRMKLDNRHNEAYDDFSRIGFIISNEIKEIEKLEISKDSKVIIAPDLSKNGGLFFMNRMGWKIDDQDEISVDRINKYRDLGAEFLILATNEKNAIETSYKVGDIILKGTNLHVFKLKTTKDNKK